MHGWTYPFLGCAVLTGADFSGRPLMSISELRFQYDKPPYKLYIGAPVLDHVKMDETTKLSTVRVIVKTTFSDSCFKERDAANGGVFLSNSYMAILGRGIVPRNELFKDGVGNDITIRIRGKSLSGKSQEYTTLLQISKIDDAIYPKLTDQAKSFLDDFVSLNGINKMTLPKALKDQVRATPTSLESEIAGSKDCSEESVSDLRALSGGFERFRE